MNRRTWQFRAHMCVAGAAVVLGSAASAQHLAWLAIINAVIFGANIMGAWMARP